jgi:GntR family transcriptional regulator / MocR family aminotransferase
MGQNKGFELRGLQLDQHGQTPFYRQVYERIRDAIVSGILRPTERLPSTRSLASQLATARGTIDLAYSLLSAEGYILSRGAGGTFVAPALSGLVKPPAMKGPSSLRSTAQITAENAALLPFQMGLPALDAFPSKLWSRLATRRARTLPIHAMRQPDMSFVVPGPADIQPGGGRRLYGRRSLCAPYQADARTL